jgi:hypothetical protein
MSEQERTDKEAEREGGMEDLDVSEEESEDVKGGALYPHKEDDQGDAVRY